MGNEIDVHGEGAPKKPSKKRLGEAAGRLRDGETKLSNRASVEWHQDERRVCGFETPADIVSIESLKEILMKSRTAESLLTGPSSRNLEIFYDRQTPASQFYARESRDIVTVNPYRQKGDILNLLTRELRRVWQHHQGALVNPLSFDPDEAILVNRAQQADCFMISIKVAWELKLIGENDAWNFIAGSPMADVSRTFEIKASADFRTLNNGEASRAAYDKFFEDSRTRMFDKRIIHQMLLDESGYIKTTKKPARVSMDLFKRLGEMPHGRNYLSMQSNRLPADACYATVEDRSNANFLWFIKFERSFQEKEAEMLKESVQLSAEIVDFAKWAMKRNAPASLEPG